MPWDRKQRQEAILREKIAVIVLERLSDPRLGFITITNVELSKDKKIAKVFYTVLGTDAQIRSTSRALADGRGRVQEMLAPTLNMRSMPELRFIFNEQVQKESRLLDIISEVTAERVDRAGPDENLEGELEFGEVDEDGTPILEIAEEEDDAFGFEPIASAPQDAEANADGDGAAETETETEAETKADTETKADRAAPDRPAEPDDSGDAPTRDPPGGSRGDASS